MSDHAIISPSGFYKIELCRGSLAMAHGKKDVPRFYSAEGTAAHDLASRVLQDHVSNGTKARPAEDYIGDEIEADGFTFTVTEEMADAVTAFVDGVMIDGRDGADILVEQRLVHGPLIGVSEDQGFGRGDAVILDFASDTIIVPDFKYGKGLKVFAKENSQCRSYGLGAFRKYELVHDWKKVRMQIYQPRINHMDTWECTVEELLAWAQNEATPIAQEALRLLEERIETGEPPPTQTLRPGEKQCQFCLAAKDASCPVLESAVAAVTGADDSDFTDERGVKANIAARPSDDLSTAMSKVGLVEIWCRGVRAEIERRLFDGQEVPGYKIVTGKLGNRKWTDKVAAEDALKAMRLRQDEMYSMKVISPTVAEKVLKESPRRWASLQKLITRAPGRNSVAPVEDAREAVGPGAPDNDFADERQPAAHPFRS